MEELVVTVPGCARSKCAGCLLRPNVATCVGKPQGSKVTVIEVDGKALMLAGKLSLSRRAINGGTCGHPCVASSTILLMNGWISASLLPMFFAAWIKLHDVFALLAPVELP